MRAAVSGSIPSKIILSPSVVKIIAAEARASEDGTETGGILLGTTEPDVVIVRHAGQPGPRAVRQPTFFLRDLGHAQRFADEAFELDQSIWIGEWHTHLDAPAIPSKRDIATYQALLADTDLAFDYFVSLVVIDTSAVWLTPGVAGWIIQPTDAGLVPILVTEHKID